MTALNFTAQAAEILAECDRAEATCRSIAWRGDRAEVDMLCAIADIRSTARRMPLCNAIPEGAEDATIVQLSAYEALTELREWRLEMEMVMDRIPALRRKS